MRSPIEQEIIDGKYYWDNISPTWLRLIEKASMEVVGHYKIENSVGLGACCITAVRHARHHIATGSRGQQRFQTSADARYWIEQNAKDHWLLGRAISEDEMEALYRAGLR
jgi:hypothetical protein